MKNLGYPVSIRSTTRLSPSSYPTLSSQVGKDTEIAWAVSEGTAEPSGIGGGAATAVIAASVGCSPGRSVNARPCEEGVELCR
jgi:hypothetical protein